MIKPFMNKYLWYSPALPLKEKDKVYGGTIGVFQFIQLEFGLLFSEDLIQGRISIGLWRFAFTIMIIAI